MFRIERPLSSFSTTRPELLRVAHLYPVEFMASLVENPEGLPGMSADYLTKFKGANSLAMAINAPGQRDFVLQQMLAQAVILVRSRDFL